MEFKNASDAQAEAYQRLLVVGPTGSGKSALTWTLPGRKFVYVFDPNTMATLQGCPDCFFEEFYPDILETDSTLKGFNRDPRTGKTYKGDAPKSVKEPSVYMRWIEHFNELVDGEHLKEFDWLVFDSLTFLAKAVMDRQLYINGRYGDIEELGDYRVVGSKISDVFGSIAGLPINVYSTGHLSVFQDDKTKKIVTQIYLPGKARNMLPLSHTNVWLAEAGDKPGTYQVRTVPDSRGLQEIRSSIRGLAPTEDVTIKDFKNATRFGVGALLEKGKKHGLHNRVA